MLRYSFQSFFCISFGFLHRVFEMLILLFTKWAFIVDHGEKNSLSLGANFAIIFNPLSYFKMISRGGKRVKTNQLTETSVSQKKYSRVNSSNVVYLLSCLLCPKAIYIGETGNTIRKQINGHKSDIRNNKNKPVAKHFNLPEHSVSHLQVSILKRTNTNRRQRQIEEQKLISKFNCLTMVMPHLHSQFPLIHTSISHASYSWSFPQN